MKYRICPSSIRHSDKDNFATGCEYPGQTQFVDLVDVPRVFDSPRDLVQALKKITTQSDVDCFLFDSCDEPGRIDVQFNSATRFGRKQSAAHENAWKEGKADSYAQTWSFYVETIETNPVTAEWGAA